MTAAPKKHSLFDAGLLNYAFNKNIPVRTCLLTAKHGLRGEIVYEFAKTNPEKHGVSPALFCVF